MCVLKKKLVNHLCPCKLCNRYSFNKSPRAHKQSPCSTQSAIVQVFSFWQKGLKSNIGESSIPHTTCHMDQCFYLGMETSISRHSQKVMGFRRTEVHEYSVWISLFPNIELMLFRCSTGEWVMELFLKEAQFATGSGWNRGLPMLMKARVENETWTTVKWHLVLWKLVLGQCFLRENAIGSYLVPDWLCRILMDYLMRPSSDMSLGAIDSAKFSAKHFVGHHILAIAFWQG